MKQIISLSIVSIAFDTLEMRRMSRALYMYKTAKIVTQWSTAMSRIKGKYIGKFKIEKG